jgi:hypothetical protein
MEWGLYENVVAAGAGDMALPNRCEVGIVRLQSCSYIEAIAQSAHPDLAGMGRWIVLNLLTRRIPAAGYRHQGRRGCGQDPSAQSLEKLSCLHYF